MKLAICMPSRGLIHSRTVEALQYAPEHKLFISHALPIPDCFNNVTQRALEWGADIIWMIEEDIAILPDTYKTMKQYLKDYDVVACNYAITPTHDVIQLKDGYDIFATGCTMFKRKVLENYTWTAENHYKAGTFERIPIPEKARSRMYGMHDIEFSVYCKQNSIPVKLIMDKVDHYKVREMGERGRNDGYHIIKEVRDEDTPNQ